MFYSSLVLETVERLKLDEKAFTLYKSMERISHSSTESVFI